METLRSSAIWLSYAPALMARSLFNGLRFCTDVHGCTFCVPLRLRLCRPASAASQMPGTNNHLRTNQSQPSVVVRETVGPVLL